MELEKYSVEVNSEDIVNELLDQNSHLRMEIASLRSAFLAQAKEFQILQQMKHSQNISPEVMEILSKLDIK